MERCCAVSLNPKQVSREGKTKAWQTKNSAGLNSSHPNTSHKSVVTRTSKKPSALPMKGGRIAQKKGNTNKSSLNTASPPLKLQIPTVFIKQGLLLRWDFRMMEFGSGDAVLWEVLESLWKKGTLQCWNLDLQGSGVKGRVCW